MRKTILINSGETGELEDLLPEFLFPELELEDLLPEFLFPELLEESQR